MQFPLPPPAPETLPGWQLKHLLGWASLNAGECTPCNDHAARMDREGPLWCRDNLSTIVSWLREEIERRQKEHAADPTKTLPLAMRAFLLLPRSLQDRQLRALVRLAIVKAEWAAVNQHLEADK